MDNMDEEINEQYYFLIMFKTISVLPIRLDLMFEKRTS